MAHQQRAMPLAEGLHHHAPRTGMPTRCLQIRRNALLQLGMARGRPARLWFSWETISTLRSPLSEEPLEKITPGFATRAAIQRKMAKCQ